mmetsp:Transcript_26736/g.37686  ORF Transcript_26736/g.37686 Transcript_26736/m.37686 type:complete len:158 (-) Transcript_26736:363-836(-)
MGVFRLAVISGMLGATSSCLAKYALAGDSPIATWSFGLCKEVTGLDDNEIVGGFNACEIVSFIPRGLCLLLMIISNITMAGMFLEGMNESGSVVGTALASAANFITSAFFGVVLFGENISSQWLVGFVMVLVGVGLLSDVKFRQPQKQVKQNEKKDT